MRNGRLLGLLGCLLLAAQATAPLARVVEMELAIYDGGRSCPGGCDAHVVFHPSHNGTRHASFPVSSRDAPLKCQAGLACEICFGEADDTCMIALYRGGGPARGWFAFTPTFYDAHCGAHGIPAALARKCAGLDLAAWDLGYGGNRVNCFDQPDHALCERTMRFAAARQAADAPERGRCLCLGQGPYNQQQADPTRRRSDNCDRSPQAVGCPNEKGERWCVLLPGACRDGMHVGLDGLNCCSGDVRFAASVHPECTFFFPRTWRARRGPLLADESS